MKYVIDTSVDIKTYVQEQDSGKAVRLRNEYHQGAHELIAPDIFPTEMCNVLMILEAARGANSYIMPGQRGRRAGSSARQGVAVAGPGAGSIGRVARRQLHSRCRRG